MILKTERKLGLGRHWDILQSDRSTREKWTEWPLSEWGPTRGFRDTGYLRKKLLGYRILRSSFRDTGYSQKIVTYQMFAEKRSWITKYMSFSVFLLIIRYKWKIYKCKTNRLTSHRFIMGTMLGYHEVLNIACQHSIEAEELFLSVCEELRRIKNLRIIPKCLW